MIKTSLLVSIAAALPVVAVAGSSLESEFLRSGIIGMVAVVEFSVIVVLWKKMNSRIDNHEQMVQELSEKHRASLDKNSDAINQLVTELARRGN